MGDSLPLETDFNGIEWQKSLKEEVARYGAQRVYEAGLEVLGYPPTWAQSQAEYTAIFNALEE